MQNNIINELKECHALTTPGQWAVKPVQRPDLDDDPMGEYVIESHQPGLEQRYFDAEPESEELARVHKENAANALFIQLAHEYLPSILRLVDMLELKEKLWMQQVLDWEEVISRFNFNFAIFRQKAVVSPDARKCVVACRDASGVPDLYFVRVRCNDDEYSHGDHYAAAEKAAKDKGYMPYLAFDENDPAGKSMLELFDWSTASIVDANVR